jgi:hypothetical protein
MTYIWQIHDNYPESMIGEYDRKTGPDRSLLKNAKDLSHVGLPWCFAFRGHVSRLRQFDDLANNAMVPLISPRLSEIVMTIAEKDAQLLPVEIHARDGEIRDYRLLNALVSLSAVNRLDSEFSLIPGTDAIMSFRRLALIDDCLDGHHLARCAEYGSYLLVSEQLANAILEARVTGMQLTQPCNMAL